MNAQRGQKLPKTSHLMSQSAISKRAAIVEQLRIPAAREGALWLHQKRGGVPPHRHAELEINVCVAGSAAYLVDNRRFALARRTALWLFPAQDHMLVERSPDFAMWIVVWKPGLLERVCRTPRVSSLCAQTPDATWISRLESEDCAQLERLFGEVAACEDDSDFNAGLAWLLLQCFAAHGRSAQPVAGRAVHPAIERAARLLQSESLGAPELARRVGLSPSRLSRLFHAQVGQTLTQFRAQTACERFLHEYDGRNYSLVEAAQRAGFGSYAQFHRALRAQTGLSPAQHRARLRE
jgi:AraC-like DNA-binding protein